VLFLVAHFHCVRFARNKVSPQMILSLSSLSSDDAKLWLGISELALIVSAIVLVVGLLGEWPDSESWKNRTLYKLSKAAVILGVFGELLGDAGIFETSARLQVLEESAIIYHFAKQGRIRKTSGGKLKCLHKSNEGPDAAAA